jgi:hypothetical protein
LSADYPPRVIVGMLVANVIPLLHLVAAAAVGVVAGGPRGWLGAAAVLYLLPPLAARLLTAACGKPSGRHAPTEGAFLVWWATLQLQTLFLRLPFLEELLRLVPGLYSAWLRLWGSRVGSRVYWSAGTVVLDRGYLDVGEGVVFGAGVRLNGHVLAKEDGRLTLIVDVVRVGAGAAVGGYSLLTAGTEVAPGETLRACLLSPPYSRWEGGRRVKGPAEPTGVAVP